MKSCIRFLSGFPLDSLGIPKDSKNGSLLGNPLGSLMDSLWVPGIPRFQKGSLRDSLGIPQGFRGIPKIDPQEFLGNPYRDPLGIPSGFPEFRDSKKGSLRDSLGILQGFLSDSQRFQKQIPRDAWGVPRDPLEIPPNCCTTSKSNCCEGCNYCCLLYPSPSPRDS